VRLQEIADRPEPRSIDRSRNPRRIVGARVLLSASLPYKILFGSDLVADRDWAGHGHIDALIVDTPLPHDMLRRAEAGDLDGRIELACALFAAGVVQSGIAEVLRIDKAEVTRLRQIAAAPFVQDALRSGRISLGHARVLARKNAAQQAEGISGLTRNPVSVRAFESARTEPKVDPNLSHFTDQIEDALGAPTKLFSRGKHWTLCVTWTHLAELQGILETLGRGNATGHFQLPKRPRSIVIECDSVAELESLTEHLLVKE